MKFKKVIGVTLISFLLFANSLTAFAAGISPGERVILDKLKAGFEIGGTVIQLPAELMNQVENELLKNDTDITEEQAVVIVELMDEVIAIAKKANITTIEEAKDYIKVILPIVQEAADVVGYTVAYNVNEGGITVVNPSYNTVFTTKDLINQTGFNMNSVVMLGGGMVTLLAACIVVASKKNMFVNAVRSN